MSTFHAEQSQALHYQNNAVQRLTASQEEVNLLSQLIQPSPAAENSVPLRKSIFRHWTVFRAALITLALFMSATIGWLIPRIIDVA